ncbi:MAG TPA: PBP1A family penicillin-binding protein [Methylophilaceae bacterium]|nr:PBP1A family penicillin-binding protein [Methylophilaceae bacterium]
MFFWKWLRSLFLIAVTLGLVSAALFTLAAALIYPTLPSLDALTDYRPKVPLRVYSEDGSLIGEFGEERRAVVNIENVPDIMKHAILAAEDERFYSHGGVDTLGVLRAAIANLSAGGYKEGASTITMQVARNFFLSREKTATRKLSEALLAIKIEHSLTKDQILELYINQIYLGQRAYGFAAASQVYYGKPLDKLTVAEAAMLAGLPKAPSRYNPFANPKRAAMRQHYVLGRMKELNYITPEQYEVALKQPQRLKRQQQIRELQADYVAEIARQVMYEHYKDDTYNTGLKVYTTIRKSNQDAANSAVLQGILHYDWRHGYRGPEKILKPEHGKELDAATIDDALDEMPDYNGLLPAVITEIDPKMVKVRAKNGQQIEVTGDGLSLVQKTLKEKKPEKRKLKVGAVVRILRMEDYWKIVQLPQVEAAFIAVDPANGAVRALVGGFDFNRNKFNHVTQAWRQPGSSFKPFIYSAALEKGFTPASIIEDEPITISAAETGSGQDWEPHNFDGKYDGPIRLRVALTKSKNMVSIRLLQSIGISYARDYITRFGFSPKDHPPYLPMALGAGSVTPWQMSGAYSVFANTGYRVRPYIISKIVDGNGKVVMQAKPDHAGDESARVIDKRNAFIMTSMLQDVAHIGTAAHARELGRSDIAGKTGTTNNHVDAWFAGFNPKQVGIAWMGYDQPRTLGGSETGGRAALPIWMDYMAVALKGVPDVPYEVPDGVVSIKIDPLTGTRAEADGSGIYEYFYKEYPPPELEQTFEPVPGFPESVIPGMQAPAPGTPSPVPGSPTAPSAPAQRPAEPAKPKPFTPFPGHSSSTPADEGQLF